MVKEFYLAGAIAQATDAVGWRNRAKDMMPPKCYVNDPLKHEVDYSKPEDIVRLDYRLILKSHAVIAFVGEHSWGTAMELAFACSNRIPVYAFDGGVYSEGPNPPRMSPWLKFHCLSIDTTLTEVIDRIWRDFIEPGR